MNVKTFFSGIIIFTSVSSALCANENINKTSDSKKREQKPNVIIVMTDDQGYGDLSIHGNPILQTPELDNLHDQSIRFTDFHVAPMCTPTRAQLLTGLDAVKTGAVNVSSGRSLLKRDLKTIADLFSENGYRTGIFGKWHLGDNYPFRPEDRGFQECLWFPSSHIGSVPDYWGNNYFDDVYIHNGERKKFSGYSTDIFFNTAMEWMNERTLDGEPFFAYIPTNTPHQPYFAHEEDIKEMERVVESSQFSGMAPDLKYNFIRFLAMIRNIDHNIGRLMAFLEEKKLRENTILVFLTDNGSTFGEHYFNAGMRGRKVQLWEGGHRVPCFISWPSGIGFDKPRDIEGLTQVQDILPTLLDLCEIKLHQHNFDGISLANVIRGKKLVPANRLLFINYSRMPFFFDYPSPYSNSIINKNDAAVLWKQWRLLNNSELYDLSNDPLQQNNVIKEHPKVANYLTSELNSWWGKVEKTVNNPERIIIGSNKENPSLLTACDWLDVFLDQQAQVERGVKKNSYWLLEVVEKGLYDIELRRWPNESEIPLTGQSKNGKKFPISHARISIATNNGSNINRKKEVVIGDLSAEFTVELNKGPITLHTWFDDIEGEPIVGAYYVYIKKR